MTVNPIPRTLSAWTMAQLEGEKLDLFELHPPRDREKILEAQENDSYARAMIRYKDSFEVQEDVDIKIERWVQRHHDEYFQCKGFLYHFCDNPARGAGKDKVRIQLFVPKSMREEVMREMHTGYGAHLGWLRMVPRITERFYWPRMIGDIRGYVDACIPCAMNKNGPRTNMPLSPLQPIGEPFSMVGCDIFGPYLNLRKGTNMSPASCATLPSIRKLSP